MSHETVPDFPFAVVEQRRHRRTPIGRRVGVTSDVDVLGTRQRAHEQLRLIDVSPAGVGVEFPSVGSLPEPGDSARLTIHWTRLSLSVEGTVRHATALLGNTRVGIQFDSQTMTPRDRAGVEELIAFCLARRHP